MSDEKDYTFSLSPGNKTRYMAGPFDAETRKPHYEIFVSIPAHVRNQVEIEQVFMGTPENRLWVWDIRNKSSWPAFITIKKDGEKVEYP
ncbi:MAG: hypothetical protein NTY36_01950 [Deltaproteobacteria bacterium]|nr:hypothetical protein [Deltaproteobacteria bacterium]